MWTLEQCLGKMEGRGSDYTYPEIVKMATGAAPFRTMTVSDDASARARDMPSGDPRYATHGAARAWRRQRAIRAIFEKASHSNTACPDSFLLAGAAEIERLQPGAGRKRPVEPVHGRLARDSRDGGPQPAAVGISMLRAAGMRRQCSEMRTLIGPPHPRRGVHPGRHAAWECRLPCP